MSDDQPKRERFHTPKGIAKWVRLNEPDTKFKDEGEYQVALLLGGDAAEALKEKIDAAIKDGITDSKANKANEKHKKTIKASQYLPYKADTDKEGNETGLTAFNFKAIASGVSKKTKKPWTFKPALFDVKGQPFDRKVPIWSGSMVIVAYEMNVYGVSKYSPTMGVGVSLRLIAVQITKLVTGSGRDASAFGFEAQEDADDEPAGEMPAGDAGDDTSGEEF